MDKNSIYYRQVQLLVRLVPYIAKEPCFALKGGTAINLFVRNLPRLSVDIDLVYLPLDPREVALQRAQEALTRIGQEIVQQIPQTKLQHAPQSSESLRLTVMQNDLRVKIELSPVLRGSVFPPVERSVVEKVEDEFGYAEMQVLSWPDLYAGKICAALDRQHPRDLFDIKLMLENEGLPAELRQAFLVYLISHHRPIAEVINPRRKNIRSVFAGEFASMTQEPVQVEALEDARERLIQAIQSGLTEQEKQFLLSFKSLRPQWELLGLPEAQHLPAVKWKILNLQKIPQDKHRQALEALQKALDF